MSDEKTPQLPEEQPTPQTPEEATPEVAEVTEVASEDTQPEPVAAAEAPAPQIVEPTPEQAKAFVKEDLAAARASLRSVQLYGSLIVLLLAGYMIVITAKFTQELQPQVLAETTTGFVAAQIDEHSPAFLATIEERVPAMIQQGPDVLIEQMPSYRQAAEAKFEEELRKALQASSDKLNANLESYIADHKEEIKAVIEASKDPDAVKTLSPTIRAEVMAFLDEVQADGKSINDQVKESQQMMLTAEQRIHRLATAKDLTPEEKKTRRAIAIIANTIEKENLKPVSMPVLTGGEAAE